MTSKIIVNNIEADVGVSTITFGSNIQGNLIGNVTGTVNSSGIITASRFIGNVTGNLNSSGVSTITTLQTGAIQTTAGKPILNSSGSIIQTVYGRSDAFTTYSAAASGDGTTVSALSASITPISATNRIICNWMISGEMHHNTVWLIHRNGALITTAGEEGRNSVSNNRWVGFTPTPYDVDNNSTPFCFSIQYSQIAGTTSTITYAPAVRGSGGSNYTFYLNRTVASTGTDNQENGVSTFVLYEVVV